MKQDNISIGRCASLHLAYAIRGCLTKQEADEHIEAVAGIYNTTPDNLRVTGGECLAIYNTLPSIDPATNVMLFQVRPQRAESYS